MGLKVFFLLLHHLSFYPNTATTLFFPSILDHYNFLFRGGHTEVVLYMFEIFSSEFLIVSNRGRRRFRCVVHAAFTIPSARTWFI